MKPNLPGIQSLSLKVVTKKVEEAKVFAVQIAQSELKTHTAGGYADQFYTKPEGLVSASLGNTAQQTVMLEGGTKPHRIPLSGYAHLRFIWTGRPGGAPAPDSNGYNHFAYVNHPGTRAYQILQRALILVLR